ncbi:hypothetical protein B0H13DRAFT_1930682 [Mycena leptocephala]|nr:hypothetical protein B0H13DRAFT_1930682 [Mycena leptocephala]
MSLDSGKTNQRLGKIRKLKEASASGHSTPSTSYHLFSARCRDGDSRSKRIASANPEGPYMDAQLWRATEYYIALQENQGLLMWIPWTGWKAARWPVSGHVTNAKLSTNPGKRFRLLWLRLILLPNRMLWLVELSSGGWTTWELGSKMVPKEDSASHISGQDLVVGSALKWRYLDDSEPRRESEPSNAPVAFPLFDQAMHYHCTLPSHPYYSTSPVISSTSQYTWGNPQILRQVILSQSQPVNVSKGPSLPPAFLSAQFWPDFA